MDKETIRQTKKVNFSLDKDTVAFLDNIKNVTGLTQSKVLTMFVNRYGDEFAQDLAKYSKKGETVSVSAYIE